jgi:hypothetical protein
MANEQAAGLSSQSVPKRGVEEFYGDGLTSFFLHVIYRRARNSSRLRRLAHPLGFDLQAASTIGSCELSKGYASVHGGLSRHL